MDCDRIETLKWRFSTYINEYINRKSTFENGIDKIYYPEFWQEVLNYKPQNKIMKQFKNRFGVKGDIFQLLKFEKELIKLGYTIPPSDLMNNFTTVEDFKSSYNTPYALYITCGLQCGSRPGTYIPSANEGNAETNAKLFYLPGEFEKALKHAAEEVKKLIINPPLFITLDGVEKYIGDSVWYLRSDNTHHFWEKIISYKPNNVQRFFDTEQTCLDYLYDKPLYSKKQIEEAFRFSIEPEKEIQVAITFEYSYTTKIPLKFQNYLSPEKLIEKLKLFGKK